MGGGREAEESVGGMEGVGGGLRMERERRGGGLGGGRPQSLHARPGLHLQFIHSAEMSFLQQTGCTADSPRCSEGQTDALCQ